MAPGETFGSVVKRARERRGLSQKDLAALVTKSDGDAISPQFFNDIEHDRRYPSRFVIERLAAVLQVDPLLLRVLAGQPLSDRPAHEYAPDRLLSAIRAYRRQLGDSTAQRSATAQGRHKTR